MSGLFMLKSINSCPAECAQRSAVRYEYCTICQVRWDTWNTYMVEGLFIPRGTLVLDVSVSVNDARCPRWTHYSFFI